MCRVANVVAVYFDEPADRAVRALWRRLDQAGVGGGPRVLPPHVTFAAAKAIPRRTRDALKAQLRTLAIPHLWLSTLGTFPTTEDVLMLAAVVDSELLAVHSAIHDVLAGQVQSPQAYYMPGSWVPHCTLALGADVATGFATLYPVDRIEARVDQVVIYDTVSGEADVVREVVR
jgi:2'-5' RNA ligase